MNPDSTWLSSEKVFQRFEDAWSTDSDPPLRDFLPGYDSPERLPTLLELIKIDLEYRWQRGEQALIEKYLDEFPELGGVLSFPLDLLREEATVRAEHGRTPTRAELISRFPDRADELEQLELPVARAQPQSAAMPTRFGRYEVRDRLGQGGFGIVYRAWDPQLQREVALKVPRTDWADEDETHGRALREAQNAARLRHPGIVPIFEVGEDDGTLFIVSAFVPGPTLAQVLRDTRPAPAQVAQWVAALADALDYAHRIGIVHRDIKPANVLLDKDGRPMLTDFGLARHLRDDATVTREGDLIGTLAYMSPEQAEGKGHSADARSDVYSLGVVLYEGLCGQVPFTGQGVSVLRSIRDDEPKPLRQLSSAVPLDLETICLKALAKEPDRRYASASALADDLRRFLQHLPISARRIGPVGQLTRWCRRKPALAATLAVSVTLIAVIAGVSFRQILHERDRYLEEWNRAEKNLYQSLIDQTKAELRAKSTGWWWRAMDTIENASKLDVPQRDKQALRDLAIQCMCAPDYCFRLSKEWPAKRGRALSVALSPDGAWLASSHADGPIILRALPGHEETEFFAIRSASQPKAGAKTLVRRLAFHPDGRRLVTGSADGGVRLWRLPAKPDASPVQIAVFHTASDVFDVAVSPDGSMVAAACKDNKVYVLRVGAALEVLHRFVGHRAPVTRVSFSRDGTLLASASRDGQAIRLWDISAGTEVTAWKTHDSPSAVQFDATGSRLAWSTIESMGAGVSNLDAREILTAKVRLHDASVADVAWHPRGLVATASSDGKVRLWNPSTFALAAEASGDFAGAQCLAVSATGSALAVGYTDGAVRLWELATPPFATPTTLFNGAAFLDSGQRLASWHLSYRLEGGVFQLQPNRPGSVLGLCLADDDRTLTLARQDGMFETWDTKTAKLLSGLKVGPTKAVCAAGTRAGHRLAVAGNDGAIFCLDCRTNKHAQLPALLGRIQHLAWSPDGTQLAAQGERGFAVWNAATFTKPVWQVRHPFRLRGGLAFGRDFLVVGAGDGKITLHDRNTGAVRERFPDHPGGVACLALSADERRLASAGLDETVRIWNLERREQQAIFAVKKAPSWLKFDPQADWLFIGENDTCVWHMPTRRQVAVVTNAVDACIHFSKDGSRAFLGTTLGPVRVCEIADFERAKTESETTGVQRFVLLKSAVPSGHIAKAWSTVASPDGKWFATGGHDALIHLWDAKTMKLARTLRGHTQMVWHLAFSADSQRLASASTEVKVWDVADGTLRYTAAEPTPSLRPPLVRAVAFHPIQPWLFSAATDSVHRWDARDGKDLGVLHKFPQAIYQLAIEKSGRWLAAACEDHHVAIWDLRDSALAARPPDRLSTGHKHAVWAVAFSEDGRYLASGSSGGVVELWDTADFSRLATIPWPGQQVRGLAFSPGNRHLAIACFEGAGAIIHLADMRTALAKMQLDW